MKVISRSQSLIPTTKNLLAVATAAIALLIGLLVFFRGFSSHQTPAASDAEPQFASIGTPGYNSRKAIFRFSEVQASSLLDRHLQKSGMNLRLPYVFLVSREGYVFGPPQNSFPDCVILKMCYQVNGCSGDVERLKGNETLPVQKYQFLSAP